MYCHLRKLVIEYLGIVPASAPPKEISDLETCATELSLGRGLTGADLDAGGRSAAAERPVDGPLREWSRTTFVGGTAGSTVKSKAAPNEVPRATPIPRGIVVRRLFV